MALYVSKTLGLNIKGQQEELKKEGKSSLRVQAREKEKITNKENSRKLYGHIHRLPATRTTKQTHDMTSTLKRTTNWVIVTRKDLQKENIKQAEILDKDSF